ncbi:glycosyltransferase family 2 protein [Microvirga sp. 3-52]|uniref:glycosyltransferase family 2 protein n=1 Tax=Microvirga sp. 3-52 TaxID=2792425 RepID=UPI001ACEB233|nr:glycosyltransferase family 2 protein [Microvirga sp. 3-52]MBO1905792.1 glycosyltransferase family 2 protein [Microvirga sp. 3-52]MBS7453112.1 glycosyltransferase family 2 protein [Microvirga sp. 3-52]
MRDHNRSDLNIDVSIIIVNWNKSELTLTCLRSIAENTFGVTYEVIVIDNGSDADQISSLRQVCATYQAHLIELKQNLFFGEANNIGAEFARGATLLLLNNDVIVPAGYILPLLDTLNNAYCAGAVGPKFIYPDGRLQEAGAYIRPDGWSIQHGKADASAHVISMNGPHIVDYCSAACLLIRRDVFLRAGGFDPLFDPAYFEDADLMFRLRSGGLFTYLCTDVTVVHYENATSSEVWDRRRLDEVTIENHRRFMERWGAYISQRLFADVEMPSFGEILWTPEEEDPDLPVVRIHGPGQVRQSREWTDIIVLASKLAAGHHIILVADEACSRCRVFTLACRAGVKLRSFSIARASAVETHSEDSIISLRVGVQKTVELVSASGPRLDHIRNALQAMDLL